MRSIFNMGVLKLLLALSILFGLVGAVYYAHSQADKQLEEFSKERKQEDTTEAVIVDNYELKEIGDDNSVHWKLLAKKGTMDSTSKDVDLVDVNVKYFKDGEVSMQLDAPKGVANELSRRIVLKADDKQKVMVGGDEKQAKLQTEELELTKNNQFVATGGVNIMWPGVAKITGAKASGSFSKGNLAKLVIRGDTHAQIQ